MKHVDESQYEIAIDVHGIKDGPRLGRLRLQNKVSSSSSRPFNYYVFETLENRC